MNRKLRTSTAILLGLGLFLVLLIGGSFLSLYASFSGAEKGTHDGLFRRGASLSEGRTLTLPLEEALRGVELRGAWSCRIEQGEASAATLRLPEGSREEDFDWEIRRGILLLRYRSSSTEGEAARAELVLPELTELNSKAAGELRFAGFEGETLSVRSSGAVDLKGEGSRYRRIEVRLSGAGEVDLREVPAEDVLVDLKGAGSVELFMEGGLLEGELAGVGSVRYGGEIRENRVKISGLGTVSPR